MARPYTQTVLPDPGFLLKRLSRARLGVYRVSVELVGEVEVVQIPGRKLYRLPNGSYVSDAKQALAAWAGEEVEPCIPTP